MMHRPKISAANFRLRRYALVSLALYAGIAVWPCCLSAQELEAPVGMPVRAVEIERPYNIHFVVTETFLNSIVMRNDVEPGEVRDQFEDTPIAGQQVTATRLCIDLVPSESIAQGRFVLDGNTSSTTSGFSPQGVVNSVGRQQFRASKDILFDGRELSTRHASVSVSAESQNVGAVTKFTGRPLGPLVERVILSVAEQRQPAAQAFARQRVIERVYPRFDQEIDDNLARGNQVLKDAVTPRLESARLLPERIRTRSTDQHLHLAASLAMPADIAPLTPAPQHLIESHGVSIYVHETLFQGFVERMQLAGLKTSTQRLKKLFLGMKPDAILLSGGLSDLDVEIEFDEHDPFDIRIGEEETFITLRARFRASGQALLPPYEVTLRYRMVADKDEWTLQVASVEARSRDGDGTTVTEKAVARLIETGLPPVSFPKTLPIPLRPEGQPQPQVTSIRSGNGWLVIGLD